LRVTGFVLFFAVFPAAGAVLFDTTLLARVLGVLLEATLSVALTSDGVLETEGIAFFLGIFKLQSMVSGLQIQMKWDCRGWE